MLILLSLYLSIFIYQQRLRSPFGLTVTWDGKRSAQIAISTDYWNNTCGLCGTFDDNPANDFLTPNGMVVSNSLHYT